MTDIERERIRDGWRWCLGVFACVRIGLTVVAMVAIAVLPHPQPEAAEAAQIPPPVGVPGWDAPPVTGGWHNLVTAWERFDALWFLRIADEGYRPDDGSAAFFPLYPLVTRGVSAVLGGRPLAAGLLVANLAFLLALVIVYFLTASELDERAARRTVVYLAVFPSAFFLVAPYSESLFLLLAAGALWGARRERWWIAGACAGLAALTRNVGVLLALPLAIEALAQRRPLRLGWALAPVAGLGLYLAFWAAQGEPLAPFSSQASWQREGTLFLVTLVEATREALRYPGLYPGGYHQLDWVVTLPMLAAAGSLAVRGRRSYAAWVGASILAPLSLMFASRPLMSLPRFLLPLFPLLWAPAAWAARRGWLHDAWIAGSAILLGLMTVLFVNWYYVF